MANTLVAEGKLQFYPTSEQETYRMLPFFGRLTSKNAYLAFKTDKKGKNKAKYADLILENKAPTEETFFDYFLYNQYYEAIKKIFQYELSKHGDGNDIVIADLFAGEGKWLETFKTFIPNGNKDNIVLVANEIEKNRYKVIKSNRHIDECYNSAFEDLVLPKKSVSLMLFNPPYGESNGERNVRRYLRMILNEELIADGGVIAAVIRDDDVIDCVDLLAQHFWTHALYRVNEDEYKKYKQYVYIGRLHKPFDAKTYMGAYDLAGEAKRIKEMLKTNTSFTPTFYQNKINNLPAINWQIAKNNIKIAQNKEKYISKDDTVWKWIKDISELKDLSCEKITLPKPPSTGEIANIISSGMINGELSFDNGNANHVVVGGVKNLEREESETKTDKHGKKYVETTTIKYTEPYLNLLINDNGQIRIKELGGSS